MVIDRSSVRLALALVGLVASLVFTLVVPLAEAGGMWSVWLYNFETGELLRVYEDGSTEPIDLGLQAGERLSGGSGALAFTPQGDRIAACIHTGQKNVHRAVVIDAVSGVQLLSVDLGPAQFCQLGPAAFDDQGTQLAIGVVYHWPGAPKTDPSRPMWEMQVVDVMNGQLINRLGPDTAALSALAPYGGNQEMPYIALAQQHAETTIALTLEPYGAGGWFMAEAFWWDMDNTTVTRNNTVNQPGYTRLNATGESVSLVRDETYPAMPVNGPTPQGAGPFNVVGLTSADENHSAIYAEASALNQPAFIDNGRRVAVHVNGPWNAETQTAPERWIAIDRDGSVVELPAPAGATTLIGADQGFVVLIHDGTGAVPQISLIQHQFTGTGTSQKVLWTAQHPAWMLVHSTPMRVEQNLESFRALVP